ncbi:MAG: M56 family metallopeptidase [Sphingomonas sp.]|nr:M56 family metallopeptidase [Sphingomonas sp.]
METLLPIAAKSFLVAGIVLLLLKLAQHRSASDRSWIAHLGLVAVLLLPLAAIALPALEVQGPSFLAGAPAEPAAVTPVTAASETATPSNRSEAVPAAATFPVATGAPQAIPSVDWAFWVYAAPAGVLILLTLIALARLVGLKGRAHVLVEPNWLTALARAQQRMGFKSGTALLTSNELPSPISWGLMRPVILLNSQAAESHAEAEAIIAHELAHVASLDWAKLLLSRVTTALFWFNPLVWVLAREAHQLREEAADDAVLGANIEDTEYARLLVGVARHECRGLLIGAHGVAPSKNSLSRRVRRVLDGALSRAPGGWRWSTAAAFFAAGMAVPVAALNFVPATAASAAAGEAKVASNDAGTDPAAPYYAASDDDAPVVSSALRNVVSTSVAGALAVVHPHPEYVRDAEIEREKAIENAMERRWDGIGPKPGTVGPRPGSIGPKGPIGPHSNAIERAIAIKVMGVTPEYLAALRASSPRLRSLPADEAVGMKAVGVTAEYVRDLAAAGYGHLDADDLVEARALNIRGDFIRGISAAGYRRLSLDQLIELRAMGVTGADIERFRRAGYAGLTVDQLVEMKAVGVDPDDLRDAKRDARRERTREDRRDHDDGS